MEKDREGFIMRKKRYKHCRTVGSHDLKNDSKRVEADEKEE